MRITGLGTSVTCAASVVGEMKVSMSTDAGEIVRGVSQVKERCVEQSPSTDRLTYICYDPLRRHRVLGRDYQRRIPRSLDVCSNCDPRLVTGDL